VKVLSFEPLALCYSYAGYYFGHVHSGKHDVTIWRVCPIGILTVTRYRGQHETRPAYILDQQ